MIFHSTPALAQLLETNLELQTKAKSVALWGEWLCDTRLLNMDMGYSSDRVVLAINEKTLFSLFFPFDAVADFENFNQTLFYYIYWTLSEETGQDRVDFGSMVVPDILDSHFIKLNDPTQKARLRGFSKSIDNYLRRMQDTSDETIAIPTIATIIRDLNSKPKRQLAGKSPLALSLELIKSSTTSATEIQLN